MQKKIIFLYCSILFLIFSCNSGNKKNSATNTSGEPPIAFFPVTDFLEGQLRELDSLPVTPLKIVIINGKTDSAWLLRSDIRKFASPFLTPVFDSVSMMPFFTAKSFLDKTINSFTLTYDANNKSPRNLALRTVNVYIDPQTSSVQRIYLVKQMSVDSTDIITQLTWITDKLCSIRTILQKSGESPEIREEKMIWNFDN